MSAQGVDPGLAWRLRYLFDPPRARLWRSTNQAIATGAGQAVAFDTARYSVGGGWSAAPNPSRWTAPVSGLYRVEGGAYFDSVAGGNRRLFFLRVNGATLIAAEERYPPAAGVQFPAATLSAPYQFAAGDYVELVLQQDSGGNVNALTLNDYSPWLAVERGPDRA
jgi:hypothetical protein